MNEKLIEKNVSMQKYRRSNAISPSHALLLRSLKWQLMIIDAISLAFSFTLGELALSFWSSVSAFHGELSWISFLYIFTSVITIVWFFQLGHYNRRKPFWDEIREIYRVIGILFLNTGLFLFLGNPTFPRSWFVVTCVSAFVLIPFFRFFAKQMFSWAGIWDIPTVILGCGRNAQEAMLALASERLMGFKVIGFLAFRTEGVPDDGYLDILGKRLPVQSLGNDPLRTLFELGRPNLVVALETTELTGFNTLIEVLGRYSNNLYIVPPLRGLPLFGMEASHFFSHEVLLLRVRDNLARPFSRWLKRFLDLVGSIFLLLALSPLFAVLVLQIRRDGGPALFGHIRIGRDGKPFTCLKFRSMVPNAQQVLKDLLESDPQAQSEWERDFKLKDDPRITRIGDFLRRTSLDELPQLWNVVKGEMSLVGPRPIVQEELERYRERVHHYLKARPGMTGLWQISGRNDTNYDNRVFLDAWYVKNWSIWYDVAILFKTISVVLGRKGAY
jgi:Undecaprenyl-phosphate galactose phosphotransferase WbaP